LRISFFSIRVAVSANPEVAALYVRNNPAEAVTEAQTSKSSPRAVDSTFILLRARAAGVLRVTAIFSLSPGYAIISS
jgi:hypothetical protein